MAPTYILQGYPFISAVLRIIYSQQKLRQPTHNSMHKFIIQLRDEQIEADLNQLDELQYLGSKTHLPSGGVVIHNKHHDEVVLVRFDSDSNMERRGYKIDEPMTHCCGTSMTTMISDTYRVDVIPSCSTALFHYRRSRDWNGRVSERLSPSLYIVPLN